MTHDRRVLLLQARNLGDAVISTALVETIAGGLPGTTVDVLTRPEIAQIFATNPHVSHVYTGRFPMSSLGDFGWKEALALPGLVRTMRRNGYTDVANLQGDFREEILGRVVSRRNNWSPAWPAGHPGGKVVRPSVVPVANRPVPIPDEVRNMHDAAALLSSAVSGTAAQKPALYAPDGTKHTWSPQEGAVGLHPMASQPCRRWDMEKWSALARVLADEKLDVHVFGSPGERQELDRHFAGSGMESVRIVTGNLQSYFAGVSRMRVLLCPDSFAAHVAYALGVPRILLNGANDAAAWAPPGTAVLAAGPGLSCYPCYNRPTCLGTDHQFACIRRIELSPVVETVRQVLQGSPEQNISRLSRFW